MKSLLIGVVALAAVGCGDNIHPGGGTDGGTRDGGNGDAGTDGGIHTDCNYTEMFDGSNDYLVNVDDVEETGLTYSGSALTICGTINNGHFNIDGADSIDIDDYRVQLSADADVITTLLGSAQDIPDLGIYAYNDQSEETLGGGYFIYDHGVFSAHLPAGTYEFSVEAYGNGDIPAPIPYRMNILPDQPETLCPAQTGTASYTEAHDGALSNQNDMVEVTYPAQPGQLTTFTLLGSDAPEPTNLTLVGGTDYLVTGAAGFIHPAVGSYLDVDTYLVTTGPTSDQLRIRLDWPNSAVNFDYYLFTAGDLTPIERYATTDANGVGEYQTIAVQPDTQYWLWVGARTGTTLSLNTGYSASVCAETFTP